MNIADPTLKEWQRNSGFSLKELAMIQPEYTFHHPTFGGEVFLNEETGKYGVKDERTGKTRCKAKYDEIIWAITPHGLRYLKKKYKYK
ncbi:MAG: hypothetical protein MRY83_04520, partial [Flavobacteriales bacterium]|nr:hypothetical protein [Flavobacteriales bacterium]